MKVISVPEIIGFKLFVGFGSALESEILLQLRPRIREVPSGDLPLVFKKISKIREIRGS